jgi:hypothetical protein
LFQALFASAPDPDEGGTSHKYTMVSAEWLYDEHGIDRFLDLGIVILIDTTRIHPRPVIPRITSDFAERLQFHNAANCIQLVNDFILDVV